jgi:hypothetical protein
LNKIIFILALLVFLALYTLSSFTVYESLSISLFVYSLFSFIENLGKKLIILDMIILVAIFTCLLMPIVGYYVFPWSTRLARMWYVFMRVPTDEYFAYMFPATVALIIGLKLPVFFRGKTYSDHLNYMVNAKAYVGKMKWQGVILIIIGIVAGFTKQFVPGAVSHVMFLASYLTFVGIFYCLYSSFPNKRLILILVFGALIMRSLVEAMFGELIFMAAMTLILILLGTRTKFMTKFSLMVTGVFIIFVLQIIKPLYRQQVWRSDFKGSQIEIFTELASETLVNPSSLFNNKTIMFNLYYRFNQGHIVSMVMQSVPRKLPHAHGETIFMSLAGSLVPRLLWPDKPDSGGGYNFKRFLGITLKGYSIGLSPYGEAWGNYGKWGGVIFMFFFGLMFNFFFQYLLRLALNTPSIILWCPFLFFYAVKIETDIFTMVNSFTKAAIFAWVVYKIFPRVFKMHL